MGESRNLNNAILTHGAGTAGMRSCQLRRKNAQRLLSIPGLMDEQGRLGYSGRCAGGAAPAETQTTFLHFSPMTEKARLTLPWLAWMASLKAMEKSALTPSAPTPWVAKKALQLLELLAKRYADALAFWMSPLAATVLPEVDIDIEFTASSPPPRHKAIPTRMFSVIGERCKNVV